MRHKRSGNHTRGFDRAQILRRRVENGTAVFHGGSRKALPADPDPAGLSHYGTAYLCYLESRNYSPLTVQRRQQILRRFLWWCFRRDIAGAAAVDSIVMQDYQAWLWRYRKSDGLPMTVGTQRGELLGVKNLFRWLVRQGVISRNPADELELPRPERRLPQDPLTRRQIGRVLGTPDIADPLGLRDRAMLELLYSSGLRRCELAALAVDDLNSERATLRVRKGKGNKERVVPLGRCALRWLRRYLLEVRPRLLIRPEVRELFLTGLGRGFPPKSLGQHLGRIMRRAKIMKGGPHLLRHTCATHFLEGGADLRFIQQLLGHEKADTTALYAQVSISRLQKVHARCHPAGRL